MADPVFKPATSGEIEALIAMMRELYAHDSLKFDEEIARRALQIIIGDESFGRVFMILLADEIVGYAVLTIILSGKWIMTMSSTSR